MGRLPNQRQVPDAGGLIGAGRDNAFAVAVISHGEDGTIVPEELHELTVHSIDAGTVVGSADNEAIAVRAEADATDFGGRRQCSDRLAVSERP